MFREPAATEFPPSPKPSEDPWPVPYGWARVYHATGQDHITRPVILADGFGFGASDPDELWDGLENQDFPFISTLRNNGYDLILIGYDQRNRKIQDNAEAATATILRAIAERIGDAPLTVGGFSMGGLVTRYALAKMEHDQIDHQVSTYISYDSPHRGAWIPLSLQKMAHVVAPFAPDLAEQINSDAARQLLWRHTPNILTKPREDPLRTQFLAELSGYGNWPQRPLLLGVANGASDGQPSDALAGALALSTENEPDGLSAKMWLQDNGPKFQAGWYKVGPLPEYNFYTENMPRADSAPGGTLASFGIAAENLRELGYTVECDYPTINFVPSVSAVSIRDVGTDDDLYLNIDEEPASASDLDEFKLCRTNTPHTKMTTELGEWILERLPK
jgi:pimeloyl-ACP methyl ester carboxylesterase